MITTDDLARIQWAVRNREEFEATGLEKTAPLYEAYLELQNQMSTAPEGTMVEIIEDPSWGKWDALIEATQKAHGIDYNSIK
jgi:hypothetical protein